MEGGRKTLIPVNPRNLTLLRGPINQNFLGHQDIHKAQGASYEENVQHIPSGESAHVPEES